MNNLYSDIIKQLSGGIIFIDITGTTLVFNNAARDLLGADHSLLHKAEWPKAYQLYLPDKTTPCTIDTFPLVQALEGELIKDRAYYCKLTSRFLQISFQPLYTNGKQLGVTITLFDITSQKEYEAYLQYNALYDALTGLPNRNVLKEQLDIAIERKKNQGTDFAVLFLDCDHLKEINDTYGHQGGDELLIQIAHRLRSSVRHRDIVVRLGGDEYVILLVDINDADIEAVLDRIEKEFEQPFSIKGDNVRITVSLGISKGGADDRSAEDYIREADVSMYEVKKIHHSKN